MSVICTEMYDWIESWVEQGPLKQAHRQNRDGSLCRRYHPASVHQMIVTAPQMSAMGRSQH